MLRVGKKVFSWNSAKFRLAGIATQKLRKIGWDEKITRELVYAMKRDGTPVGTTSGKYEPGTVTTSWLVDDWYGTGLVPGMAQTLAALGGTPGLADLEMNASLQLFEERGGSITINFPLLQIIAPKMDLSESTSATEVEIGFMAVNPIQVNGVQLASVLRSIFI